MSRHILVDRPAEGVIRVKLNRPQKRNALSNAVVSELIEELSIAEADESVRALIIGGSGSDFCAGADLGEHFDPDHEVVDIGRSVVWERLESSRLPIVASVQGWAITGGFLLAMCCDVIVASKDARFRDTHALLSLIPTGGETQRLPRSLGFFPAKELMLTSRILSALDAHRLGFVAHCVAREDLESTSLEIAEAMAALSPRSVASIKRLINMGSGLDFASGMRLEAFENRHGAANRVDDAWREGAVQRFRD